MKRCAVCGKFQKSTTEMILHNGKEVCPKCAAMLNLNESTASVVQIEAGPRGVTKHQMIPAIKANINNPEALRQLAKDYPTVFNGSVRYLLKKEMQAVQKAVGTTEISEEHAKLIARLNPSRKGVTYHQILAAVKEAAEQNDKNMIVLIKKYYKDLLEKSAKYLRKDYRAFADV